MGRKRIHLHWTTLEVDLLNKNEVQLKTKLSKMWIIRIESGRTF